MGKGRQALDMDSEQARERVRLGVTELRELRCDVLHRAMPLAQLHSGQRRAPSNRSGGGGESVGDQCHCQSLRASGDLTSSRSERRGIPLLEPGDALAGEVANGIRTCMLCEEPQRRSGYVVVVAVHTGMTCC